MNKKLIKNICVTGGAGYIGAHFVNKLNLNKKFNIYVLDNFQQGKKNIIKNKKINYYNIDLKNKNKLNKFFKLKKIDLVVHFAALASVPDSVKNPADYYANNIIGGLNLLEAMIKNNINKIIFSSSASVYGEPKSKFIKENHPKNPTNPYGYTKLVFENFLIDYHKAYGLNSISFRYFCAAGVDELQTIGEYHNPETHIIPLLIETALGVRKKFYVYGHDFPTKDGTGIRDYIHVNDLAEAHILAIKKLQIKNMCEFYNLGINKGYSVLDLIKTTEKITNKKIEYEFVNRRPGDPSQLIANSSLAYKKLGWKPKYKNIEQIIKTTFDYKLKNTI